MVYLPAKTILQLNKLTKTPMIPANHMVNFYISSKNIILLEEEKKVK